MSKTSKTSLQTTLLCQDLHSGWEFQQAGTKKWYSAEVPGCVHTDLRRHDMIPDPFYGRNEKDLFWIETTDWNYRLDFKVDASLLEETYVELVAEGLDTIAVLRLNGEVIGENENMFVGQRIDVKRFLKAGQNRLEIDFKNPMDYVLARQPVLEPTTGDNIGGRAQIRKQQCSFGWDWGPRLASSGVWRPIRLEAWSDNRIEDYYVTQEHSKKTCTLRTQVNAAKKVKGHRVRTSLSYEGVVVAEAEGALKDTVELEVKNPELWWPNGLGEQPLYQLTVEILDGDTVLDSKTQRIGLCELELDQHPDQWGTTFQFKVNGKPFFAKGANWIPSHSFVNEGVGITEDILNSAVDANMNMMRVWGGGIYELESFYEGCLERGLLVWQDFMFACWQYPGDKAFVNLVRQEAIYQVKRLRNYSHMALWCGNNEIEQLRKRHLNASPSLKRDYERVFRKLLPEILEKLVPGAPYISSSEHNPDDTYGNTANVESGDVHFWGVWHSRQPISAYEDQLHRFFSEFGMQSYPHPETAATFTKSKNLFAPEMDNHQKNGGGNQVIFHYISELFRFPKDYQSTVYLSQIMQAFTLRFGIEHMRRNMPRTMGAIFWQINDCWPVASWSSIDFGGRWKALQYASKRFFAPALVSVKVLGKEWLHRSTNSLFNDVSGLEVYTVYDAPFQTNGLLKWDLWSISGNKVVESGEMKLKLQPGKSVRRKVLKLEKEMQKYGRNDLVLRTRLSADGLEDSVNTTFLTAPKYVEFPEAKVKTSVKAGKEKGTYEVTLTSDRLAYQVYVNLKKSIEHRISDNFFDIFPGEKKTVILRPLRSMTLAQVKSALTTYSYLDCIVI